jgi:hypothetical protein
VTAPLVVADFDVAGARPHARELVDAAADRGARFVAVRVVDGDDETPEAHLAGRRVATLERLAAEARRAEIGLFLRLEDTLPVAGLAAALGADKSGRAADLAGRFLVVVDKDRTGKRLRSVAPQFPSAFELPAAEGRSLARFLPANLRRATADADDLVVPWGRIDAATLAARIAPQLARRGARLWISHVPEAEAAAAAAVPAAGIVVRFAFA